jgi:hypothetical protein
MPSLAQTIRDMQEAAMTSRQKKAIADIEKDKKLSDKEKFKKIDSVMKEESDVHEETNSEIDEASRSEEVAEAKMKCPECDGKGCDHCDNKGSHDMEEAQMYVVRYNGKDKTSDSSPMSKAAADARAKRGNSVDKVGGKYTVVSVNSKGNDMKEFHAPGMAPKPKKKASPSSTKKSLGDISKRANEEVSEAAVVDTQMSHSASLLDTVNAILMGKRDEMEESKSAALSKKLAKASASSEKGKKAVTLKKAPWEKKDEDASNDKSDDGEGMDKVDKKAVKKKFDDRKDKDIDNDGDIDSSDKYLHKKRQAVSKAIDKDEPKKKAPQKKTGTQEPVDVDPTLDEEALQQKINAILEKLKEKKSVFEKKYGSRCEKVMYATAKKMAMK